jgi:hypothetical protein
MPLETVKTWTSVLVFVGIAVYVYSVGGISVVWYAAEYGVSTDRVYIDPEPTDCDFWRAPLGVKGCHYEKLVVGHHAEGSGTADYRYDSKTDQLIDLRTNEVAREPLRPSKPRFDSVFVSWIKKSD